MKFKIFKIKKGKKAQWLKWCSFLNTHKKEVLKTLKEEGITREFNYLFKYKGEYFVLYGMEGKFLPPSDCELNRKHFKNLKECLERIELLELFDFEV